MAGRKIPDEYKRKYRVKLNFDKYEWEKIQGRIEKLNVKQSVYMRSLILRGYYREAKYPKIIYETIVTLQKTGGLLKEHYNKTDGLNADLSAKILHDIEDVITLIKRDIENSDRETD